jgi:hypothetical protein
VYDRDSSLDGAPDASDAGLEGLMPLFDYYCGVCGQLTPDVYRSVVVGAQANPPQHCARAMVWIPQVGAMDIGAVKGAGFHGFTTTDARGNPVQIDSLHKLRQVERDAEQAARNGEGQPMVWRRYAQDGSNRDQPTLSKTYYGGDAPTPQAKHRFGSTLKKSAEEPARHVYGPGVDDSNTSALKGGI